MKKPKFLMRVDSNNNAKIYLNKHWIKDCFYIFVEGTIDGYHIELTQYVRDSKGRLIVDGNEIREKGYACDIKRRTADV